MGIALLLAGLWQFSLVMIALDLLFISNKEWAAIAGFVNRKILRKRSIEEELFEEKELVAAGR